MTVFWDLDGPILDVSERYWRIHRDILEGFNRPFLNRDEYWEMKRQGIPESDILSRLDSTDLASDYQKTRQNIIEERDYLLQDRLQKGAKEALLRCSMSSGNVLVTLRGNEEKLIWQLDHLGISTLFQDVMSSGEYRQPRWRIKYDLMADYLDEGGRGHVFVTDIDTDLRSGSELGMFTIGISNGIRGPDILKKEGPKILLENTYELMSEDVMRILEGHKD